MDDKALLNAFEGLSLPASQWNHRAHVRVAFLYASRHGLVSAIDRMRAGVQALNRTTGTPETLDRGYHETITQAFMRLIYSAYLYSRPLPSSVDYCDRHPELLEKSALCRYYTSERLKSWQAKTGYVPPDIHPLPIIHGNSLSISPVLNTEELRQVRDLFLEYARSLDRSLCFQQFDEELQRLPGNYAAPSGRLFLARDGQTAVGCGALRPLTENTAELKRLWVASSHRHHGLGRALVNALVEEARTIGYSSIQLDTLPSMTSAIRLYQSLGFFQIAPYGTQRVPGALFFQLNL